MSTRTLLRLFLSLAVAAVAAAPGFAQAAPDATVTIRIKRQPRISLQVTPRGVGVCKVPGADCGNQVTWQAGPGAGGPARGEYLVIRYKSTGGGGSSACFGATTFSLGAGEAAVSSGPVAADCPTPTVWFYSVELWSDSGTPDDTSDDAELCDPLDPGVIIDSRS